MRRCRTRGQRFGGGDALVLVALAHLADVVLGVELDAQLGDEVELSLEEVDVALLVRHQLFEQIARDVILRRVTMSRGLLVKRARRHFGRQVSDVPARRALAATNNLLRLE